MPNELTENEIRLLKLNCEKLALEELREKKIDVEWLIDYDHNPDMDKKRFLKWRPSYVMPDKMVKPIGVEVGVLEGFMSKIALKYVDFGKYYLVDPYKKYICKDVGGDLDKYTQEDWDNIYNRTREKFKDDSRVEFIRKVSQEAVNDFPDESLDFVYIDAHHSYSSVLGDTKAWYPKVKKGGYLAGHDLELLQVSSAVCRFYYDLHGDDLSQDLLEESFWHGANDWWIKKL